MQNKIDRLIQNANNEFTEQRNVIAALVDYSRCLDMFDLVDRSYKIQLQELYVRIAICYDILGNFNKTVEFLNKALFIVPNVSSLILYKSVLLQTLGKSDEAQKILVKYKQISGKVKMDLYETFRLVFYYSMQLEKEVLLREINEYLEKYTKNAVVLYLRSMIYLEISNNSASSGNPSHAPTHSHKKYQNSEYYLKYETDLKEALQIEPHDTEFLIKDGITNENITKLFFMILPDMDFYQPKPLANYKSFHCGLKVFYVIFKAIKMLKIKVEKKKIKNFYSNKLKLYKKRLENSKSVLEDSSNNYSYNNSMINPQNQSDVSTTNDKVTYIEGSNSGQNKSVITNNNTSDFDKENSDKKLKSITEREKGNNLYNPKTSKSPTIVNIKNNVEKADLDDMIKELKKEYELKIKSLFKSVWLYNLRMNDMTQYNFNVDFDTNYFIKNKYYAPFNLKESLLNGIKQNIEYKHNKNASISTDKSRHSVDPDTYRTYNYSSSNKKAPMNLSKNFNSNNNGGFALGINVLSSGLKLNEEVITNLSVSEINHKHNVVNENVGNQDSMSISSDINLLEIKNNNNNEFGKSGHVVIGKAFNMGNTGNATTNTNTTAATTATTAISSLNKFEKDQLRIQKVTTEVIKNEVLNSKKYIHRPSPRREGFKLSNITNKLSSLSKDRKSEYSTKLLSKDKKITPTAINLKAQSVLTNPNTNNNSIVNITGEDVNTIHTNNFNIDNANQVHNVITVNNINTANFGTSLNTNNANVNNISNPNPTTNVPSMRKSLDLNKLKLTEDILKKGGNGKPVLFKNLSSLSNLSSFNNKITNIITNKYKKSESATSGGTAFNNVKTNENV